MMIFIINHEEHEEKRVNIILPSTMLRADFLLRVTMCISVMNPFLYPILMPIFRRFRTADIYYLPRTAGCTGRENLRALRVLRGELIFISKLDGITH